MIAAVRVVLLLLAGAAIGAGFTLSAQRGEHGTTRYGCPMHPDVTGSAPGPCPICGMALVSAEPSGRDIPASSQGVIAAMNEISLAHRRLAADRIEASAWVADDDDDVAALVYRDDLAVLAADEHGTFTSAATSLASVEVERRPDTPPSTWDASTSKVLFRPIVRARHLPPGGVGRLVLPPRNREILVVPDAAVLHSAEGAYVLAAIGDGPAFGKRSVTIGKVVRGFATVLSGLRDQERVVVRSAFVLDAQRRLDLGGE